MIKLFLGEEKGNEKLMNLSLRNNNFIYLVIISLAAILFNFYYGLVGVFPIDSFFTYNAAFEILNGKYPFKDFWTITGPFLDFTQAIFFYIFGVNWISYILHAALINSLLGIVVFYSLNSFGLKKEYSFFYSILVVALAYPNAGTPYVDHHSSILSIISILIFIMSVKKVNTNLWYLLPILFFCSFLTKQSPTSYIFLIISLFYIIFLFQQTFVKKTFFLVIETIFISIFIFLFLYLLNIKVSDFYKQYIDYPISIGENRFQDFLFPFDFKRIFLRQKWIHLSLIPIYYIFFKNLFKKKFYLSSDFIIYGTIIFSSYAFIFHQLMTINGMFIFFLIPIYAGLSQIFINQKKELTNISLAIIVALVSIYYFDKYVQSRNFMDLTKKDLKLKVDATLIHENLYPLKWVTYKSKENENAEIDNLIEVIEIIKNDNEKKSIITDYQFISVVLNNLDNSPSKYWYNYHVYPIKGHRLYNYYRDYFINVLKKEGVKKIFVIKPIVGDDKIVENIFIDECYEKIDRTEILDIYNLERCSEIN